MTDAGLPNPPLACLRVDRPGIDTWIVDHGRLGYRDRGVTPGGPADSLAHDLANALLGNQASAATIEFSLIGPLLTLEGGPIFCALTGAIDQAYLEERVLEPERSFRWLPGQTLRLGGMARGARGYLAIAGGIHTPLLLGSRQGQCPLAANQTLPVLAQNAPLRRAAQPIWKLPAGPIRVTAGPEFREFEDRAFLETPWKCSSLVNRMGCRLEGPPLARNTKKELLSEPVLPGTIQVNHAGLPMILGVQCQTIGGYPRIACVIRADLDKVGQLRPGDPVILERVELRVARTAWREKQSVEKAWRYRFGPFESRF